jgi:hypothetical protein
VQGSIITGRNDKPEKLPPYIKCRAHLVCIGLLLPNNDPYLGYVPASSHCGLWIPQTLNGIHSPGKPAGRGVSCHLSYCVCMCLCLFVYEITVNISPEMGKKV